VEKEIASSSIESRRGEQKMISAVTAISIGSFLLSLLVGYFFWIRLRQARLQVELLQILLALRDKTKCLGELDNPQYLATKRLIEFIIDNTDVISLLGFVYYAAVCGLSTPQNTATDTDNSPLGNALSDVRNSVGIAIISFVLYETVSGILIRFIAWIIPKASAMRNLKAGISRSVDAIDYMSHGAAGC
jgi:hypothetical protein